MEKQKYGLENKERREFCEKIRSLLVSFGATNSQIEAIINQVKNLSDYNFSILQSLELKEFFTELLLLMNMEKEPNLEHILGKLLEKYWKNQSSSQTQTSAGGDYIFNDDGTIIEKE